MADVIEATLVKAMQHRLTESNNSINVNLFKGTNLKRIMLRLIIFLLYQAKDFLSFRSSRN